MIWLRVSLLGVGVLLLVGLAAVWSRDGERVTTAAPPPATSTPVPATAVPRVVVPTPEATPWRELVVSRVVRDAPTPTPIPPRTGDPRVTIVDFGYDPPILRVTHGQRVIWTSVGSEGHDAVGDGWWSGALSQGQSFSRTFSVPGRYDYFCTAHPDMRGRVIVD